ncbi:MAG: GNAT family N-acetyltransferase [Calditrichaeota bacterium]|nr:GNAT family N-acetyltransferase [Calditrichota bacterium]
MLYRLFEEKDVESVAAFLNSIFIYDNMTRSLLFEKTFGDDAFQPDMTWIVENGNEIIAFMQGVFRHDEGKRLGWIKLFGVAPDYRRRGIATELLNRVELSMKEAGVEKLGLLASYVNYFQPGIDPRYTEAVVFAERRGFTRFDETENMEVDLIHQSFETAEKEAALQKENFFVRRATAGDKAAVVAWAEKSFPSWVGEILSTFKNDPISLHLAFHGNDIVAFSAYDANNKGTGWFGPIGTDPICRGKGIGGVLLRRCLNDMKKQGQPVSIIPWIGPIAFYLHYANAHISRIFWLYEKNLVSSAD